MIGTTGATVLFLINILIAGPWAWESVGLHVSHCIGLGRGKAALSDAALAMAIAVVAAYLFGLWDGHRHLWNSRVMIIMAVASGSVVVKYLVRLALHSTGDQPFRR